MQAGKRGTQGGDVPPRFLTNSGYYRIQGFTLLELLISMTIMALVIGVTVSILMTSMRVWRRCSSFSQAFPPAYTVISRLNKELKNAYNITVAEDQQSIIFHLPRVDAERIALAPLQLGHEITYFRSDESGDDEQSGNVLWRRDYNAVSGTTTQRALAENVSELTFSCDATHNGRVFSVYSTAVTVVGQEQALQYESNFHTTVAIRNSMVQQADED